jgi:hypothetical protein
MSATTSARVAAAFLLGVVGFQVAVALGAPLGPFTQGGQVEGALPTIGRAIAAVSAVVLLGMAAIALALVGEGPMRALPRHRIRMLGWIVVAYALIGTVANLASRSAVERPWAIATSIILFGVLRALRRPSDVPD